MTHEGQTDIAVLLQSRSGIELLLVNLLAEGRSAIPHIRNLLAYVSQKNPEDIDVFPDIKLVERNEDRPEGEDCFTYTFGQVDVKGTMDAVFASHVITQESKQGDLIIYFDRSVQPVHVGRFITDTTVRSKWDINGHVFDHNPYMVPSHYGDMPRVYRPSNSQETTREQSE